MGNLQVIFRQAESVLDGDRGRPRQRRAHPGVALLDHDLGEGLDRARVAVVLPHEALDG